MDIVNSVNRIIEKVSGSLGGATIKVSLQTLIDTFEDRIDRNETSIGNLNDNNNKLSVDYHTYKYESNAKINSISSDYHTIADHTFIKNTNPHISSYNLRVVDEKHGVEPDKHDNYIMSFKDGTLVLTLI